MDFAGPELRDVIIPVMRASRPRRSSVGRSFGFSKPARLPPDLSLECEKLPVRRTIAARRFSLDKSGCLLAPLSLEDTDRLLEFFSTHSAETIQARYGCMIGVMTRERARMLVSVDQYKDVALGLFRTGDQPRMLCAVGRYYTDPGTGSAEIALVVHEKYRRHGLATVLLRRLAELARETGLVTFHAQVRQDNFAMRAFITRYHPKTEPMPGAGSILYYLPLENIPPLPSKQGRAFAGG